MRVFLAALVYCLLLFCLWGAYHLTPKDSNDTRTPSRKNVRLQHHAGPLSKAGSSRSLIVMTSQHTALHDLAQRLKTFQKIYAKDFSHLFFFVWKKFAVSCITSKIVDGCVDQSQRFAETLSENRSRGEFPAKPGANYSYKESSSLYRSCTHLCTTIWLACLGCIAGVRDAKRLSLLTARLLHNLADIYTI